MTDLDDAVRNLARLDASSGFAAMVRARLDAGAPVAATWPRLVFGAAAVASLALVTWFVAARPEPPVATMASRSPAARATPPVSPVEPAPPVLTPTAPPAPASRRGSTARTLARPVADHERALEQLPSLDALQVERLEPPPLAVSEVAIASLEAPDRLSVLDFSAGRAGPGDQR